MSEVKIGARELSTKELKLTLPTYQKIEKQVEDMRAASSTNKQISFQKTNNIGILGRRGVGKTSILQTLRKKIKDNHPEDIVLEIIIPENMSESSTLMENILGLIKREVDDMVTTKDIGRGNCIRSESKLMNKYIEVIRTYTYIQKEYRDILISEFTTENEYIKKSKEVFNSDSEFMKNWNEFLSYLLKERRGNTSNEDKNPMLIVFIDDIDLSTNRCTDVVKTLLSYLSNSNIITFLSGDINTFEEALTLDFLRKEKALSNLVFHDCFFNGNQTLLARKKELSYEYLKKVLPPMFRHQVKNWQIEERGNYIIETSSDSKNLKELLIEKLEGYVPSEAFEYVDYKYEKTKKTILPFFFRMFDSTSRGLNNIYAVLQQMNNQNGKIPYEERKLLIETIISSNPQFNRHRDVIMERFISLGIDEKNVKVDFQQLYGYREQNRMKLKDENSETEIRDFEQFIFDCFLFMNFVSMLMHFDPNSENLSSEGYLKLKWNAYSFIADMRTRIEAGFTYLPDKIKKVGKDEVRNDLFSIFDSILKQSSFLFGLIYLNHALKDTLLRSNCKNEKYLYLLYKTLQSSNALQNTSLMSKLDYELAFIAEQLSHNESILTVKVLFQELIEKAMKEIKKETNATNENREQAETATEKLLTQDKDKKIADLLLNNLADTLKQVSKEELDKEKSVAVEEKEEEFQKRISLLDSIEQNNLWNDPITDIVKDYIKKKLKEKLKNFAMVDNVKLSKLCMKVFSDFQEQYLGYSVTNAKKLVHYLKLYFETLGNDLSKPSSYTEYEKTIEEVKKLAFNRYVWYGRNEARAMLNALGKSKLAITEDFEFRLLVYYYNQYKSSELELTGIQIVDQQLNAFKMEIIELQKKNTNDYMQSYIEKLNNNKTDLEKITMKDFDSLFR